jgi:hypothetical protein
MTGAAAVQANPKAAATDAVNNFQAIFMRTFKVAGWLKVYEISSRYVSGCGDCFFILKGI